MRKYNHKLIKEYKPIKGFYDLRDYDIPTRSFERLWEWQKMFKHMSDRAEYFRKHHPNQWQKAQLMTAEYQQHLFQFNKLN